MGNTTDNLQACWGSSNANLPSRVWVRWDSGDLTGNWSFYAISEPLSIVLDDPNLPDVDAGADMITWSGQPVQLDPTVVNNDVNEPQGTLTYAWSAFPADGVVFNPAAGDPNTSAAEAPEVTITKATANPSPVTLTLAVTLEGVGTLSDTMTIDVYDDACLAAKATGTVEIDSTDIDADCITGLADFAVVAADWLIDYEITEPVEKP